MKKYVFVETDIPNPIDGGNLYTWRRKRNKLQLWLIKVMLFFGIVWRPLDGGGRMSIKLAKEIVDIIYSI